MPAKGKGWMTIGHKCRDCGKHINSKPVSCSRQEHINYYQLHLKERRDAHLDIVRHYGDRCSCCGFNDFSKMVFGKRFLQLHHVEGKGNEQMRKLGVYGHHFHEWIKKNNYPPGFKVLDGACNAAM